jgi:preprotein translocase subunit SecE
VTATPYPPQSAPPPPGAAEAADAQLSERLKALKDAQKPGSAGPDEFGLLPGKAGVTPPEAPQAPSNPFAAAAEEARLITVPALPAVLSTTLAVLAIVVASTVAILAVNGLLAVTSEKLFG